MGNLLVLGLVRFLWISGRRRYEIIIKKGPVGGKRSRPKSPGSSSSAQYPKKLTCRETDNVASVLKQELEKAKQTIENLLFEKRVILQSYAQLEQDMESMRSSFDIAESQYQYVVQSLQLSATSRKFNLPQ